MLYITRTVIGHFLFWNASRLQDGDTVYIKI